MGERRGTRFPSRPRPAPAGTGGGRLPGRLAASVSVTIIITIIITLASCTPREDTRSLHRLRNEGLLHAARGTQDGYLEAAKAFERAIDIRETPGDLLNLARVLCAAGRWEAAEDESGERPTKFVGSGVQRTERDRSDPSIDAGIVFLGRLAYSFIDSFWRPDVILNVGSRFPVPSIHISYSPCGRACWKWIVVNRPEIPTEEKEDSDRAFLSAERMASEPVSCNRLTLSRISRSDFLSTSDPSLPPTTIVQFPTRKCLRSRVP